MPGEQVGHPGACGLGDGVIQAELHERAGMMARTGARSDDSAAHFERAIEIFETAGGTHPAARVSARLAEILWQDRGRIEQGLESMERAFEVLSQEEPDEDLASLAAQLGRFLFFAGQSGLALQRIETALEIAEALGVPEIFSQALNTKAIILAGRGRKLEALALRFFAVSGTEADHAFEGEQGVSHVLTIRASASLTPSGALR